MSILFLFRSSHRRAADAVTFFLTSCRCTANYCMNRLHGGGGANKSSSCYYWSISPKVTKWHEVQLHAIWSLSPSRFAALPYF
ncbi:hypothetical protein EDB89DRAFT_1980363 [Lactarius sanguifluus]|nr:hypothetical protein EDB89DRAFT_1980363 [Lactarius sanguifluus]